MKRFIITILTILVCTMNAIAQNYEKLWENVEELKAKDLPRSAIEEVEKIWKMAERKGDFAWATKAKFERMMLRAEISTDSMNVDLESISEEMKSKDGQTKKSKRSSTQEQILHALLGDAYRRLGEMSMSNKDLKEESKRISKEHFALALSDWDALAEASATDYSPLMKTLGRENDTRMYGNDMLNVIASYVIKAQYTVGEKDNYELYESLSKYYASRGNRNGALLMKIGAMTSRMYQYEEGVKISQSAYRDSMLVMARQNKDIEAGADAYVKLLNTIPDHERREKLSIIEEALKTYPNSPHSEHYKLVKARLNQGRVWANVIGSAFNPVKVKVEYSHVKNCRISFYNHDKKRMEVVKDLSINANNGTSTDTISFDLKPGNYRMTVESGSVKDTSNVSITSLMAVASGVPNSKYIITVVDGTTGHPRKGVDVRAEQRNKKDGKVSASTDLNGQAEMAIPKGYGWELIADAGNNDITQIDYLSRWNGGDDESNEDYRCGLFTDRAVYRPGHTVNVAVLAYTQRGDETSVLKDKEITLSLHDANGREVEKKTVKTNGMGSAFTEFVLPQGGLPGEYYIHAMKGKTSIHTATFRVEEYKRPTFHVEIATGQKGYKLGDSVKIDGWAKTFSGVPVQNATVKYKVEYRNVNFWYRFGGAWNTRSSGTLTTDNEGAFTLKTYLEPKMQDRGFGLTEYRVTAEVVNNAGETQQGEYMMAVAENSFGLLANVPQVIIVGEKYDISIKATSLDMKEVDVECEYSIFRREKSDDTHREAIHKGHTKKSVVLPDGLAPGNYRIEFAALDKVKDYTTGIERIDTVRTSADFTLFDPKAKTMNVAEDFIHTPSTEMDKEHPADIYFMAEHNDITLYWMVIAGDSLIDKGMKRVGNEMQHFRFDYKEEYGDGIALTLLYIKDYEVHTHTKTITLTRPDKELVMNWKTFRDKLSPGQEETWTLSIKDKSGKAVSAELLATMYDASLDKIRPHRLRFNIYYPRIVRPVYFTNSHTLFGNCRLTYELPRFNVKERMFNQLMDTQRLQPEFRGMAMSRNMALGGNVMYAKSNAMMDGTATIETEEVATEGVITEEVDNGDTGEKIQQKSLRNNFAETAFFYPHITTNKNGEAAISFTLPESLTEWKFMGLAHTADMKYGSIYSKAIASKDFMVEPNMPRFVRMGDNATIGTSIINRTDSAISGEATITLLDPETEKIIFRDNHKFCVDGKKTSNVSFTFNVTDKYPLLVCQIEAEGNNFSDGERNYLPALSNKQHITTTVPFFMEGTEDKTINIENIFNNGSTTATDRIATIEYYGNPAWMAIEALRSVAVPETDNAISISAALYANLAAEHIARQIPGVATSSTSKSPLEKNQELKNIILRESPWLAEALEENDNISKLEELLNKNEMANRMRNAEDKLRKLQNEDGSWSWFEGMSGSVHITTVVVDHIAEAEHLTGKESTMHGAMLKAMEWLDTEEMRRYEKMKKDKSLANNLSERTLHYLYVSSLVRRELPAKVKTMQNDYLDKAERIVGELTIYGRANIACVLEAHGRNGKATDFVKSLREYTVFKPELGRYYDTKKAHYSWCDYRMSTHLAAMKAMRQQNNIFADTQDYINNMTLWVIQQKRSQSWDNPINTVGAINELLSDGRISNDKAPLPSFVINGNKTVKMENTANNLGYAKAVIKDNEDVNLGELKTLQITSQPHNPTTAKPQNLKWGAVYGQCMEETDKINSASTSEISISRKIYVELTEDGKPAWKELLDNNVLKVGDKVRIRYTLTTDRDMDFIQIKAQHPACFEPTTQLSGYRWLGTQGAYVAQHDASCDFFFDTMRKGTLTFDQEMFVDREGTYTTGITTAQCAYSPEFSARTNSFRITVK